MFQKLQFSTASFDSGSSHKAALALVHQMNIAAEVTINQCIGESSIWTNFLDQ